MTVGLLVPFWLLMLFSLSFCTQKISIGFNGNKVEPCSETECQVSDTFTVDVSNPNRPVDILFVIDDSISMGQEQEKVKASTTSFIQKLTEKNVDYHIGILSTDNDAVSSNGTPDEEYVGPGSLRSLSTHLLPDSSLEHEFFLAKSNYPNSEDQTNVVDRFKANVVLGTGGSQSERGMLSIINALNPNLKNTPAQRNFFRFDSKVAFVIVSDEDESEGNVPIWDVPERGMKKTERINEFISKLKNFRPANPDLVRLDMGIMPAGQECSEGSVRAVAYKEAFEKFYLDQPNHTGRILNVCDAFDITLGNLGTEIANTLQRRFKLSQIPISDLFVKIDGAPINEASTNGYSFEPTQKIVTLNGMGLENRTHFEVTIEYKKLK